MIRRAVLFDLDGTLLDTAEDIADATNAALAARGFPGHPLPAYRQFVGDGARTLLERALPPGRRDDATIAACLAGYLAEYERVWNRKTRVYDGIPELLATLAARGIPAAVVSNKPRAFVEKCVAGYLGDFRFAVLLGQDGSLPKKPDPAGALAAARRMGFPPSDILYLGDTATDMATAIAAGMFPVGALWGFRPEELGAAGARALAKHPRDVLKYLA
ncbi:MAG: HAD family hydrolase [Planctomycetota bacterium]